ncbi:hypothetical protein MM300_05650 [Evansella sp. LMS18]|nr:TIGR03826 family flagellar region protein [Evansella sp. LMS18]UTR12909.1 hypothetical protein MM300_05650 [Evansella sp. LMS18]
MGSLSNCPVCGSLFVKGIRSVCQDCHQAVEERFEKVYTFIRRRENRTATIEETEEATGVAKDEIVQFIRQGRIQIAQFPNLGYPCEKCGTFIREGRLCNDCGHEIRSSLSQLDRNKAFENRKAEREKKKIQTYHSLNERFRK